MKNVWMYLWVLLMPCVAWAQETPADTVEKTLREEILISATRASEKTATTFTNLSKTQIQKQNFGQDIPFLLNQVPGTVINSDAGAGVGYTGIRIRGTDPTRTNVTVNGIPLNDPESHGVFWVNMPDFASTLGQIQVQRGVGTSTNGAAAFGASLNLQTQTLTPEPYAELSGTYGSFNTHKQTILAGTGLIHKHFSLDARLSRIHSDGWVDRASSDLSSWYVSGSYYGKNSLLKAVAFSGKEQTYQSWWGIPQAYLDDPVLRRSNYYTYDNETDNYQQDHYQLFYTWEPSNRFNANVALHYTYGRGYYEQYRAGDPLSAYGLSELIVNGDTLRESDFIRRRWLDNHFYGAVYSLTYQPNNKVQLTLGGAANAYDGAHFGEVIWARFASESEIRDRYYESYSRKTDFNSYLKALWQINERLSAYADVQVRSLGYAFGDSTLKSPGSDNDGSLILGDYSYLFVNPKAGLTWRLSEQNSLYASVAVANREPVRSDFIDAPQGREPLPESLRDLEAGWRYRGDRFRAEASYYFMDYDNQLVLNGELNDVGASVRQNVKDSYRTGLEAVATYDAGKRWFVSVNAALSRNKIRRFEEYLYNYDPYEVEVIVHENTDISFSPALVAGTTLTFRPVADLELSLLGKYVSRQYLDNTRNAGRSLDPFFVSDLRLNWTLRPAWAREIRIGLIVNNLLNAQYEPNGYTFSYKLGSDLFTENYYYPQAGTNWIGSVALRF